MRVRSTPDIISLITFWRGMAPPAELAGRLLASGDLFNEKGRRTWASVNFITAHDGFTLNDWASYNDKHNAANGENNNDGSSNNLPLWTPNTTAVDRLQHAWGGLGSATTALRSVSYNACLDVPNSSQANDHDEGIPKLCQAFIFQEHSVPR